MARSIAIAEEFTTFHQVEEKLGLSLSEDSQFFFDLMVELPALSEAERNFRCLGNAIAVSQQFVCCAKNS
ncbi:hypothetical protein LC593_10215 [Nostoc sp. CHAB 5844]|nr:hypothetical protein [Nostoc sp. CHAB 5844]